MSQDLRDEINPCSMPQGASRAVRELIYADWRSVITKLTVALKIGADTEPFSHSLGPKRRSPRREVISEIEG